VTDTDEGDTPFIGDFSCMTMQTTCRERPDLVSGVASFAAVRVGIVPHAATVADGKRSCSPESIGSGALQQHGGSQPARRCALDCPSPEAAARNLRRRGSPAGNPSNEEEKAMKVREAMTSKVCIANPEQSIREAACLMADIDAGALPIGENDRLVGMITDRDIAVRAVAGGQPPETKIRDVMSKEVLYCFDDEDLDDVARNMSNAKVRRLPVLNRDKRLVGILSLGDLALNEDAKTSGQTIAHISEHGGAHSQTSH
jgi:CBS domain-containing protein